MDKVVPVTDIQVPPAPEIDRGEPVLTQGQPGVMPPGQPMMQQPGYPVMQQPIMQQPMMQNQFQAWPTQGVNVTSVVVGQQGLPTPYPQSVRTWSTGLCACFDDMGVCLMAYFCPWCLMCMISSHMGEGCCAGFCCCLPAMATKLRTMLGISGGIMGDWCTATCCTLCLMCQLEREMKNKGMA